MVVRRQRVKNGSDRINKYVQHILYCNGLDKRCRQYGSVPARHRVLFSFSRVSRTAFPESVKVLGSEADQSCPSNGEVRNDRSFTSTPPYAFMTYTRSTLP